MNVERLVQMVNDIAHYFAAENDAAAGAEGVAQHLKRFWAPPMRRQIRAHLDAGGEGLDPLAAAGVRRLAELDRARRA